MTEPSCQQLCLCLVLPISWLINDYPSHSGEGEFGIVHKARWHGTIVAVKILKETGAVAIGDFRTELNVLQKVHHPYTVSRSRWW